MKETYMVILVGALLFWAISATITVALIYESKAVPVFYHVYPGDRLPAQGGRWIYSHWLGGLAGEQGPLENGGVLVNDSLGLIAYGQMIVSVTAGNTFIISDATFLNLTAYSDGSISFYRMVLVDIG